MGRSQKITSVVERNEPADLVYEMKITLRGIRPQIWRSVKVTGDTLALGASWCVADSDGLE